MQTKHQVKGPDFGSCATRAYDILAQVISVLDVTTGLTCSTFPDHWYDSQSCFNTADIWVCVSFYLDERKVLFALSLTILVLALVSYTAAFVNQFSGSGQFVPQVTLFFLALPLSPILPFVFFYADETQEYVSRLFHCCGISIQRHRRSAPTSSATKFKQFFEEKIEKHMGFILESLIEGIQYIQCRLSRRIVSR